MAGHGGRRNTELEKALAELRRPLADVRRALDRAHEKIANRFRSYSTEAERKARAREAVKRSKVIGEAWSEQHGLVEACDAFERSMITLALEHSEGNLTRAARLLKVALSTLRYRMERLAIPLPHELSRGRPRREP